MGICANISQKITGHISAATYLLKSLTESILLCSRRSAVADRMSRKRGTGHCWADHVRVTQVPVTEQDLQLSLHEGSRASAGGYV